MTDGASLASARPAAPPPANASPVLVVEHLSMIFGGLVAVRTRGIGQRVSPGGKNRRPNSGFSTKTS